MTNFEKITGKTIEEVKALYISTIEVVRAFGLSESEARKIAMESLKESISRSASILNNKKAMILIECSLMN